MATIRRTAATAAVSSAKATSKTAAVKLSSIKNADSGLKVKFDAKKQTLTVSGTAKGKESRDPYNPKETSDYLKTEEFGGTISFDFDHDKMPNFDTSAGYTEKNKWYFAHGSSIGTKAGQSAKQVADALANKVAGSYRTTVTSNPDGSATISIARR